MAETNEKSLSRFKKEMDAAKEERDERLKILDKLKLSEQVKNLARNDIAKTFEDKTEKAFQNLKGNKDEILNALRGDQNYVKIEENTEVMGYKGKKVHINLPKVGNFEGYKFDYFVSNDYVTKKDFEKNPELEKKSYSMDDVSKLLEAMNRFMAELECETDGNMKYENDLKYWETFLSTRCVAGGYLEDITGLDRWCWLSDKDVAGKINSRAEWGLCDVYCVFDSCYVDDHGAYLFLRLSD